MLSQRSLFSLGGLAAAIVLFVAINVLSNAALQNRRLDLTSDKLFTLSPGANAMLRRLEEPITLRLYVSSRLTSEVPLYGTYAVRVRELLAEFAGLSNGKVQIEQFNPEPYSDEEDRAVALGLQGVPLDQSGEQVYFGLAGTNSTGGRDVIGFLQPERERFLEYDLAKLVYNLAFPNKKKISYMSELPLAADRFLSVQSTPGIPQPWAIMEQLRQFFTIRALSVVATELERDTDVLMVVHPKNLREDTLYMIDQFVMRGGKALIFVDPHSEAESGRAAAMGAPTLGDSDLEKLFTTWGIELRKDRFAGDRANARRVSAGVGQRVQAIDYVAWMTLRDAPEINRDDTVTAPLQSINLRTPGILTQREGATTIFEPLLQTSPAAMSIEVAKVAMQPDPARLLSEFKPGNTPLVLAARIRGPASSAFPDGPPPPETGQQAPANRAPHLAQSQGPINVIVIADTDLLENESWIQIQDFFGQRLAVPTAGNANFVINALDNLAGSSDLIGLRSRGGSQRPFERVNEIRRAAEVEFRARERDLSERLKATEEKLRELQTKDTGGSQILTVEQQEAIDKFRAEMLEIRKQLRDVQFELRKDIEALEARLKTINIAAIPILVTAFAITIWGFRQRKRRRAAMA
jgi:ABC-type uncharacterized transport system involved in gliding motility auxiliary subunit